MDKILPTALTRSEKIDVLIHATWSLAVVFFVYLGIILGFSIIVNTRLDFLDGQNLFQIMNLYLIPYNQIITVVTIGIGGYITYRRSKRYAELMILTRVLNHVNYIAETTNYDYRIEKNDAKGVGPVIDSLNKLIASTEHSLAEERRIEKTKDELIANVSHDIRTPLTSTLGYLDAVLNRQYDNEEEKEEYIKIAYEKALNMRTLVNDLFLYIESAQPSFVLETQTVPILLFLQQFAAEFELTAQEQGVEIEVEVSPEDLEVTFDVEKMVRVFSNFISNALKYGGGDRIRLRAYLSQDQSRVYLETCNNGDVMEESELEQVFERSYRTEKSRNSSVPGSGLGLSIVKNIINLHGGEVYARIENNETVFRIELSNQKQGEPM